MGRVITILGMGPSANERRFDIARYVLGTEVWCLNDGWQKFPDFAGYARWYEVHTFDYLCKWAGERGGIGQYCNALEKLGVPVYRSVILPLVTRQQRFPELDIPRHFGCNLWDG